MNMIDTHTHIFLEEFENDAEAMINRAKAVGISHLLMPAIDSNTHELLHQMHRNYPDMCLKMMGLHPGSVAENYKEELAIVEDQLHVDQFVGIGEIGLDYYWDLKHVEEQKIVFNQQLLWAAELGLPVSIHTRDAIDDSIKMIRNLQNGKLKGVFHCFTGTAEQANHITDLGFYLGIGGVVTFKNSGLDIAIENISLEHIVLETDAPYLAPVPYRGKRNEPVYLTHVIDKLAVIKEVTAEKVAEITTMNAKKIFAIP